MAKLAIDAVSKAYVMRKVGAQSFGARLLGGRAEVVRVHALDAISMRVEENEFVSIVGPSGCGKTTLLRIMMGLDTPDEGRVVVDGRPVIGPGPERGFVFQDFGLYPWRSALQNVMLGLELRGVPLTERTGVARRQMQLVGLSGFEHMYPHQLSGGMQQRVGLARVLAVQSEILLMDEPFGALDAQTKRIMQLELLRILQEERRTVVFVTHDLEEALLLSDRVLVMSTRPGRILETVEVDLPRPRGEETMDTPRFSALRHRLWSTLRAQQS